MSAVTLQAERLSYRYPDGQRALHEVSFRVSAGQRVGVVGANGAGKSTLLLHFVGVHLPESGMVRVGALEVGPRALVTVRQQVGLLFQEPSDQLFMPTVAEDVAFAPQNQGLAPAEVASRVDETLEALGIAGLAGRPPAALSGGEKRLVALAAVLAQRPAALLLDEPSAGLDPRARRKLLGHLSLLPQTQVVASHDLDLVWELCTSVLILSEGRVAAHGPCHQLLSQEALLEEHGLELPFRLQR